MSHKVLLNSKDLDLTITRLCWQLIEDHDDFSQTVLIGMQPRGIFLAERIRQKIYELTANDNISLGTLDITFFRDDFRRRGEPLAANRTDINFLVENKQVIFIDDVLYTGRSIRAGLDAIGSFGRPMAIELLVLINRRYSRDMPIEPKYIGKTVDTIASQKVLVQWKTDGSTEDKVSLLRSENE